MKVYDIIADKYYPVDRSDLDEGIKKKIIQKILPSKKPKGLAPSSKRAKEYKDMLKQNKADAAATKAARDAAARKYAERSIASMPKVASALITAGGVAYYVNDYFEAIGLVEADFEEYKKNGYKADPPNRFAGMPYEEAMIRAEKDRQALLGKATIGIITTSGFIGKFIGWMGKGVQFTGLGLSATGSVMTGGAVAAGGKILTKVSEAMVAVSQKLPYLGPVARAAFATLMEQDFMKVITQSALAYMVFSNVGWFTSKLVGTLNTALQSLLDFIKDKFGIDIKKIIKDKFGIDTDKYTDTPIKRDPAKEKEIADKEKTTVANLINGVKVTDPDGFLTTNPAILSSGPVRNAIDRAALNGKPNPLDDKTKYPRRPGATYPEHLLKSTMPGAA